MTRKAHARDTLLRDILLELQALRRDLRPGPSLCSLSATELQGWVPRVSAGKRWEPGPADPRYEDKYEFRATGYARFPLDLVADLVADPDCPEDRALFVPPAKEGESLGDLAKRSYLLKFGKGEK